MVPDPTPEQIAEMALLGATELKHFGLTPRVALLSHSNFGASHSPSARKMREAFKLVRSEEHTSELQSLMRISYAVFCLKKTTNNSPPDNTFNTRRSYSRKQRRKQNQQYTQK